MKHPSPEEICAMLKKHGLSREEGASLVHASLRAWNNWSAPIGGVNHRQIPLATWELLLIKLGEHSDYERKDE
jgi:hypothetical protein